MQMRGNADGDTERRRYLVSRPRHSLVRSIARAAEEEESLDGLLDFDLDFDVSLDAVDNPALDTLLLLGLRPHDRIGVGLRRVAPRPS